MNRRGRGNSYAGGAGERSYATKSFERMMKARIEVFAANGSENELKIESMSREERKIIHGIVQKMGLNSRSTGKEPNRVLSITRPAANHMRPVASCESDAIQLSDAQSQLLSDFLQKHPVTQKDLEHHRSAHKKLNRKKQFGGLCGQEEMLVPPPCLSSQDMNRFRRNLPTYAYRQQILNTIRDHKVTLITGGTGCGKTTQVPQFLLEQAYEEGRKIRIVVTQPRRLPAVAVAERVSKERNERLGSTVGYHIRLEQKTSKETVLTYCTSGVLLRMLTVDENASDVSHIILDEIHEREQNTDYLLIALKQALTRRKDLKVILMSATMEGNIDMFLDYFDGEKVGHVDIPSRLFNVEKFYLADVLALTAYTPPSSGFGGMFSEMFANIGFGRNRRFPSIDNFGEANLSTVRTEPDLARLHDSTTPGSSRGFGANVGESMSGHMAVQSASTSALTENGVDSSQNGYGQQVDYAQNNYGWDDSYEQQNSSQWNGYHQGDLNEHFHSNFFPERPQRRSGVTEVPNRPSNFTPNFLKTFRDIALDETTLIDNYMNNGGQQWSDGIDPDLTVATIRYCMDSPVDGAILVFLPGYENILSVRDKVMKELDDCKTKPEVFTLHSQMNSADQQRVFERVFNKRKVILSTNIAEASLTIDDVVFVIDCGKVKEKTYDHHSRISQLNVTWIAKSNAEQRSGRAGRCRPGFCFRLYSREEHQGMLLAQVAEMKRSAIHEVCLHAKMFAPENIPVKKFLEMAPEPPLVDAIDGSLQFLEVLGALHGEQALDHTGRYQKEPELTELGRHLAHLPLDPQLARLLLFGIALKCCHPIVTLVASLAHRDPFVLPLGDERNSALTARDEFSHCDYSDHITLVRAFYAYSQCTSSNNRQFNLCRTKFLSANTMKMIHGISRQLMQELRRLNLIPHGVHWDDPELNRNSTCWPVIQAAIVAGCYPGIGIVRPGTKLKKIKTCSINAPATLHPGCVIKRQMGPFRRSEKLMSYLTGTGEDPKFEYLVYQELSKIDEGVTIRTVTAVPPLTVFLFAGSIRMSTEDMESYKIGQEDEPGTDPKETFVRFDPQTRNAFLTLGENLLVRGVYKDFRKLMQLRVKFMSYLMEVMGNPARTETSADKDLLLCLKGLLELDHRQCGFYECDLPDPKSLRFSKSTDSSGSAFVQSSTPLPRIHYEEDDQPPVRAPESARNGAAQAPKSNAGYSNPRVQFVPARSSANKPQVTSTSLRTSSNSSSQPTPPQPQPSREASIPEHTFDTVLETQNDEWGPGYDITTKPPPVRKVKSKNNHFYRGNSGSYRDGDGYSSRGYGNSGFKHVHTNRNLEKSPNRSDGQQSSSSRSQWSGAEPVTMNSTKSFRNTSNNNNNISHRGGSTGNHFVSRRTDHHVPQHQGFRPETHHHHSQPRNQQRQRAEPQQSAPQQQHQQFNRAQYESLSINSQSQHEGVRYDSAQTAPSNYNGQSLLHSAPGTHGGFNGNDRGSSRYQRKKNTNFYRGNSNHYRGGNVREYGGNSEGRHDHSVASPNGFGNGYNQHYSSR